jgi:hypothetical protein
VAKLLQVLGLGVHRKVAASVCGIGESTLQGWLAEDEELEAECERVELAVEAKIVSVMRKAALGGDMKTAQWYLERRYPDRWGRRIAPDGDDQVPRYSDDVLKAWISAKGARRKSERGGDEG